MIGTKSRSPASAVVPSWLNKVMARRRTGSRAAQPLPQHAEEHDQNHRRERGEGDEPEAVDQRIASLDRTARPTPSAVTKGTVTVEVVTPPAS